MAKMKSMYASKGPASKRNKMGGMGKGMKTKMKKGY